VNQSKHFLQLNQWLHWQSQLHDKTIDMGLERVSQVYQQLISKPIAKLIITVAGTNGKGSTAAMLESILLAANYRVGCYTSPHLFDYNERIRVNGQAVTEQVICQAFHCIDIARADTSLTYFEFGTLAAFHIFQQSSLDVAILEVGLGGRLDAVNLLDPDVAVITSIALDHMDWLGNTREAIAMEKLGIARQHKPLVVGDTHLSEAIVALAKSASDDLFLRHQHFGLTAAQHTWTWWCGQQQKYSLPWPRLFGRHQLDNAATVLCTLSILQNRLPVSNQDIRQGLISVQLAGRFQVLPGQPTCIVDVAHNEAAVMQLANNLSQMYCAGKTYAIFGVLQDKDIAAMISPLMAQVDDWSLVDLQVERGALAADVEKYFPHKSERNNLSQRAAVRCFQQIEMAYEAAINAMSSVDRLLVFGSFYTVSAILKRIENRKGSLKE